MLNMMNVRAIHSLDMSKFLKKSNYEKRTLKADLIDYSSMINIDGNYTSEIRRLGNILFKDVLDHNIHETFYRFFVFITKFSLKKNFTTNTGGLSIISLNANIGELIKMAEWYNDTGAKPTIYTNIDADDYDKNITPTSIERFIDCLRNIVTSVNVIGGNQTIVFIYTDNDKDEKDQIKDLAETSLIMAKNMARLDEIYTAFSGVYTLTLDERLIHSYIIYMYVCRSLLISKEHADIVLGISDKDVESFHLSKSKEKIYKISKKRMLLAIKNKTEYENMIETVMNGYYDFNDTFYPKDLLENLKHYGIQL